MSEEGFSLRHNPLGIHAQDGTDIVIGKTPRHSPVKSQTTNDVTGMVAKNAYYDQQANVSFGSDDSVPTGPIEDQLASLGISDSIEGKSLNVDFGGDFKNDMSGMLSRRNTIVLAMPKSQSQPANLTYSNTNTKTPFLAKRLQSIRKRLSTGNLREIAIPDDDDDAKRAEDLPQDVLKMIAFSPNSPAFSFVSPEIDEGDFSPATTPGVETYEPMPMKQEIQHVPASPAVTTLASEVIDSPREVRQLTIDQLDPVREDDRGRLFLQINKITNLKGLPIDLTRKPKFALSLDNGIQTVLTDSSPLPTPGMNGAVSARIGQEFELTVAKDLELVLTVKVSMDPVQPPVRPVLKHKESLESTKQDFKPNKSGRSTPPSPIRKTMKNLLRSPKKKQQEQQKRQLEEKEHEQRLAQEKEDGVRAKRKAEDEKRTLELTRHEKEMQDFQRRADVWRGIVGPQGEYCSGYVFASHYEQDIYGVAKSFAIPLYNEWDTKANKGVPKPVCDLQVTMMYVPKLYGSEQIPMSMYECQQAVEAARSKQSGNCEGFLTQQGGDCGNIWRRRYFVLRGNELVVHHEATRKRRAIIHLENATDVSDKLSDDLWCIYEDRSFQISFDDGESIGFYADTVEARDAWLKALTDAVANSTGLHRSWTDLVLEHSDSISKI